MSSEAGVKNKLFIDISDRVKGLLGIKTDTDLAMALGMSPANFSNRKQINSPPFKEINELSRERHFDLNYIYGVNNVVASSEVEAPQIYGDAPPYNLFDLIYDAVAKAREKYGIDISDRTLAVWAHDTWLEVVENADTNEDRLKMIDWAISQSVKLFKMSKNGI